MRWSIYILACLLAVAADASLAGILKVGAVQPRFLPSVVVFALFAAPRVHAIRLALLAGLICDLLAPVVRVDGSQLVVIGPWTLGFALGGLAAVPLRSLLYHRNPISGGFAVFVFSLLASVVFVALWMIRLFLLHDDLPSWWPGTGAREVVQQSKVALASGALAIPTIWLLDKTRVAWGFSHAKRVVPGAARESA